MQTKTCSLDVAPEQSAPRQRRGDSIEGARGEHQHLKANIKCYPISRPFRIHPLLVEYVNPLVAFRLTGTLKRNPACGYAGTRDVLFPLFFVSRCSDLAELDQSSTCASDDCVRVQGRSQADTTPILDRLRDIQATSFTTPIMWLPLSAASRHWPTSPLLLIYATSTSLSYFLAAVIRCF